MIREVLDYKLKGRRAAIVIGINRYNDPAIPKLSGAENDANEMANVLRTYGNFQTLHVLTGEKAKSDEIRKALSNLFWKGDEPFDLIVFYFSGHGRGDNAGNGYIAPFDMIMDEPFIYGISMKEINNIVSVYFNNFKMFPKGFHVMIILDCCHSIHAISEEAGYKGDKTMSAEGFKTGVEELKGHGKIVLISGDVDERTREDEFLDCELKKKDEASHKHGVFTSYILRGLRRKTKSHSAIITYGGLEKFLEENMKDMKQIPIFSALGSQTLSLAITMPSTPADYHFLEEKKTTFSQRIQGSSVYDIYDCCRIIKEFQNIVGEENFVDDSIHKINDILSLYEEKISVWFASNSYHINQGIFLYHKSRNIQTNIAKKIDSLGSCFNYDQFVELENQTLALISHIYDYANKDVCFNDDDLDVDFLSNQTNRFRDFIKKCMVTVPKLSIPKVGEASDIANT